MGSTQIPQLALWGATSRGWPDELGRSRSGEIILNLNNGDRNQNQILGEIGTRLTPNVVDPEIGLSYACHKTRCLLGKPGQRGG